MNLLLIIIPILIIFYVIKEIKNKKENFSINCDIKNDTFLEKTNIDVHFDKIKNIQKPKFIYDSHMLLPHNFTNNLDNNLVYNYNVKKKEHILGLEMKQNKNTLMPFNTRLMLNNYNKDGYLNQYLFTEKDELKNINDDKCIKQSQKLKINLLGRYDNNKLHLNWNINLSEISKVKNIMLFFKKKNEDYNSVVLNLKPGTYKFTNIGTLKLYNENNILKYNFFFKKEEEYKCFVALSNTSKETINKICNKYNYKVFGEKNKEKDKQEIDSNIYILYSNIFN